MARHVMTPRRRAALRKAQLASARARRGVRSAKWNVQGHGAAKLNLARTPYGRRRIKRIAGGVAVAGAIGGIAIAGHKGIKSHRSSSLRRDIRANLSSNRTRQHHATHLHAKRQAARGRGNRHLDPRVLAAQVIFTNKLSQNRVASRRKMTRRQRRNSVRKR